MVHPLWGNKLLSILHCVVASLVVLGGHNYYYNLKNIPLSAFSKIKSTEAGMDGWMLDTLSIDGQIDR